MIRITEEIAVKAVVDYLTDRLPALLATIEAEDPTIKLPMFQKIDDEYLDPNDVLKFPYACVFVASSQDEVKDRALDENSCALRIMCLYSGAKGTKKTYRYNAAIREAIQNNRTLDVPGCRARVIERFYYTPILRGDEEVRVAETFIEVTMEVQRR